MKPCLFCLLLLSALPIGMAQPIPAEFKNDITPDLWAGPDGFWGLTWIKAGQVVFSFSTDNGATWALPMMMDSTVESSWPQIAGTPDGQMMIVWRYDGSVWMQTSSDFGESWTDARKIISDSVSIELVSSRSGTWILCVNGYLFRSVDLGATWSLPQLGPENQGGRYRIATDDNGNWVTVWFSNNFVRHAFSSDDGITWPFIDHDEVNIIDLGGTVSSVASDGKGGWMLTWYWDPDGASFVGVYSNYSPALPKNWYKAGNMFLQSGNFDNGFWRGYDLNPIVKYLGDDRWACVWAQRTRLPDFWYEPDEFIIGYATNKNPPNPVADNSWLWSPSNTLDIDSPPQAVDANTSGTMIIVTSTVNAPGTDTGGDLDLFFARTTDAAETWSPFAPLIPEQPYPHTSAGGWAIYE
jgi:hypothetical protein